MIWSLGGRFVRRAHDLVIGPARSEQSLVFRPVEHTFRPGSLDALLDDLDRLDGRNVRRDGPVLRANPVPS
jgi:hypothetical protein